MQQLDVRLPMGLLFLLLGLVLVGYGLAADPAIYVSHSLGQNVNVGWGTIFILFAVTLLVMAVKAKKAGDLSANDAKQANKDPGNA